jgi:uncharacterized membrane protein
MIIEGVVPNCKLIVLFAKNYFKVSFSGSTQFYTYCNVLVGSIHDGTLLHSKFNTQLLITTLRTRPLSTSSKLQLLPLVLNLSLIYHNAIP